MYRQPKRQTAWRTIGSTIPTIGQRRYRAICLEVLGRGRSLFDPDTKPGDVERVAAMMSIAASEPTRSTIAAHHHQTAANHRGQDDLPALQSAEIAIFEVA